MKSAIFSICADMVSLLGVSRDKTGSPTIQSIVPDLVRTLFSRSKTLVMRSTAACANALTDLLADLLANPLANVLTNVLGRMPGWQVHHCVSLPQERSANIVELQTMIPKVSLGFR